MSPDVFQESGLRSAIAGFRAGCAAAGREEALWLPDWRDEDWNLLFGFTDIRKVPSGEALIRRGEPDRTLYLVLRGELEIIVLFPRLPLASTDTETPMCAGYSLQLWKRE